MIARLRAAHERVIAAVGDAIERTERSPDWGTNDLLMGTSCAATSSRSGSCPRTWSTGL